MSFDSFGSSLPSLPIRSCFRQVFPVDGVSTPQALKCSSSLPSRLCAGCAPHMHSRAGCRPPPCSRCSPGRGRCHYLPEILPALFLGFVALTGPAEIHTLLHRTGTLSESKSDPVTAGLETAGVFSRRAGPTSVSWPRPQGPQSSLSPSLGRCSHLTLKPAAQHHLLSVSHPHPPLYQSGLISARAGSQSACEGSLRVPTAY